MTEISSLSLQGVRAPQDTGTTSQQGLGGLSGGGGIFGDDLIGGVEDSFSSNDGVKNQIKSQAQELIRQAKRLSHTTSESDGNDALKKSINKKLKALQEQAKNAKLDLNEIFSEIATEMNMNKKDQKLIQKTLHIKISRKEADSSTSQSTATQQNNPFGSSTGRSLFPGMEALRAASASGSGSPAPTANPSYSRTPSRKLDKEFLDKTKAISERIGCDYRDLLAVMNSESGLNAAARNPNGGATGLIQFMPATARMLGTTTEELTRMSPTQQLDYVEKFFNTIKKQAGMDGKRLSGADLYSLVFLPGRANRSVLTQQGENFYSANRGLDLDRNGDISKQDLARRVASCYVDESRVFA